MSVATIDLGRPNLLMDHLQLGLRNDGDPEPHFYLSLYVIPWSRELGAGHVALLRNRSRDSSAPDMILTDNLDLGRAQQSQLRSVGYSRVDLASEPRPASFVRSPIRERDHVRYLISTLDTEIEARWDDLGEAIFAHGPAPQKPDDQRIWSLLFEAGLGTALVNGSDVSGETYAMDSWIPWLGRPLSSAHVARGEILVDNAPG